MTNFIDIIDDEDEIRAQLNHLRREHQNLDDEIDDMGKNGQPIDFILLQRLKKRKLALKDMIMRLEGQLLPDIIA
jgi:hypothetical protein